MKLAFSRRMQLTCISLSLFSVLSAAQTGVANDSLGRWQARTEVGGRTMNTGLELYQRADGSVTGEMIAIDRGFSTTRITKIVEQDGKLEVDTLRGVRLSLRANAAGLSGEMQQGPNKLPVQFAKVDSFGEPMKAQTPRAPFPYAVQELVITSADGVKLSGSLTLPSHTQATKAVVLIHGTGPQDRNQNEEGHQNFAVIADHLTRQGIAVLRFDKRGVKRSTGSYEQHTQADLIADVKAAVAVLRERKQFTQVGILGHSEGAELAARVAAQDAALVDFMISLAGPGMDLMQVIEHETRQSMQFAGATTVEMEMVSQVAKQFISIVQAHAGTKERMPALQAMMTGLSKEQRDVMAKYRAQLSFYSANVAATPWAHSALNSHPEQDWRKVTMPVLVLHGERDAVIAAKENVNAIRLALTAAGNKSAKIDILPGLNHNLQTAKTGSQEEYSQLSETIAPVVLQKISQFIMSLAHNK
nr:alpha/beta fold hydrolase [uncultured Undibacterium sp.]